MRLGKRSKWLYRNVIVSTMLLLLALVSCHSQPNNSVSQRQSPTVSSGYTTVTVENCGITTTYKKPPERAVTMLQPQTEILLALSLEKRMVGTAYQDTPILPKYQKAYKQIPVLAKNYPSREVLLSVEPDFIYAGFESAFAPGAAGSREELVGLGINSYLSSLGAKELCRPKRVTMENVYNEIRDIGRIFGVSERAEKLVTSMQEQLKETQKRLGKVEQPKRVFLYDTGNPPYTAACCGLHNLIIKLAGGENIFQDKGEGEVFTVNWEDVIARNPDVIVLVDATWTPAEEKRKLLLTNPAYSKITAVQKQQFIVLDSNYRLLGIRTVAGVRQLAQALYPERFR